MLRIIQRKQFRYSLKNHSHVCINPLKHDVHSLRNYYTPSQVDIEAFDRDGFVIVPQIIGQKTVSSLLDKYEKLFAGQFETGNYPDEWYYRKGMSLENITREICNAWKCDRTVASVVLSSQIGRAATLLGQWEGARVGQDDIWSKPPSGGKEISFHTDCAYIPWPEVTCWIALDDVSAANGTLEYIRGSHKWTKYKDQLDTTAFHAPSQDYKHTVYSAAKAEGISASELEKLIVKVEVPAGGCAFHNGELWHGSGKNLSTNWRRSLGIHLIPANSDFKGKNAGYIYGRYKLYDSDEMNETFFPITYHKNRSRSKWLEEYCEDSLPKSS